ncbi:VanW family protein [Selenomonas bovis]|uniref:VanW family protein n=1 Tax=Selenomonas bovis TaxID=416586 RepID=UPI00038180B3|nr:VanW family protein [Selenomonas bovis]MCI6172240.1 VanW family protein [Selenomonas bovis]MCI7055667.1 VanW family protein [Selenomonas bovis]
MHLPFSIEKILAITTISIAFAICIIGGISVSITNHNRVILGVQSEGQSLAGMSETEARQFFLAKARTKMKKTALIVTNGPQHWDIQAADIDLTPSVEQAVREAYDTGRNGSPLTNTLTQMRIALFGKDVRLTATYSDDKLQSKLSAITASLARAPKNASLTLSPKGNIEHHMALTGRQADTSALYDTVAPKLSALALTVRTEIPVEETEPVITDDALASIDGVLASYHTQYTPGNRGHNITLAAGKLNGTLVKPNDIFSFNDTVGLRTAAAGYKVAGVILDGQLADGIGGGVCQVSSTLYNAILLAGLTPTARTSHALPSAYCPPGLDATVADGQIDLQFRNQLAHSVYLLTNADGHTLTVYILGTRADLGGKTIRLESTGSRLHPSVYRLYLAGGQVIEREFLHTDSYAS